MAAEEDDALDQLVGVVHLLDAFLARFRRDPAESPNPPAAGSAASTG
jgi:hypothetical protein